MSLKKSLPLIVNGLGKRINIGKDSCETMID